MQKVSPIKWTKERTKYLNLKTSQSVWNIPTKRQIIRIYEQEFQDFWDTMKRSNLRIMFIEGGKVFQAKGILCSTKSQKKISKNQGKRCLYKYRRHLKPNRQDQERTFPHHITNKLVNTQTRENILKIFCSKEKHLFTNQGPSE